MSILSLFPLFSLSPGFLRNRVVWHFSFRVSFLVATFPSSLVFIAFQFQGSKLSHSFSIGGAFQVLGFSFWHRGFPLLWSSLNFSFRVFIQLADLPSTLFADFCCMSSVLWFAQQASLSLLFHRFSFDFSLTLALWL